MDTYPSIELLSTIMTLLQLKARKEDGLTFLYIATVTYAYMETYFPMKAYIPLDFYYTKLSLYGILL